MFSSVGVEIAVDRNAMMRVRCGFVCTTLLAVLLTGSCASSSLLSLKTATSPSLKSEQSPIAGTDSAHCRETQHGAVQYVVCRIVPEEADIRLFLNDATGEPYGHFNGVNDALAEKGATLAFAMNAGMYHEDRSPVGLYIEDGKEIAPINTNDGPGNFHLKPNGTFIVYHEQYHYSGQVAATDFFSEKLDHKMARDVMAYATQSGPMLVIDGELHPRFLSDSESLKRRNGVGVDDAGHVWFVLADTPVNFYDFANYFRNELKTPNALYLDGTISRLYAPELDRNDPGARMGPIVGVVIED